MKRLAFGCDYPQLRCHSCGTARARQCLAWRVRGKRQPCGVRLFRWAWLIVLLLVGCAPQATRSVPLPTLMPTPTASIDLEATQRVVMTFMDAWQRGDFATMYTLLSPASQEATPLEQFTRLYTDAHNLMTLNTLRITPRTLYRESERVVVFHYDATFATNVLGTFSDEGRDMRLVLDRSSGMWRVAWSLADIFAEMGNGATLRFESSIPRRANIYDRDGDILADQNGVMVEVNVTQDKMPDRQTCITALETALNTSSDALNRQFARAQPNWVVMVGLLEPPAFLTHETRLKTECNATFRQRAIRRYLRGALMPNVLGHVGFPLEDEVPQLVRLGFNAETIIGRAGVERSWDDTLRGKPGGRLTLVGANGVRLRTLAEATTQIPESIWLTIDADLQEYALRAIGEAYLESANTWGITSKGASAVVLDVHTGEVLAMVSYPTYEGNALNPFPAIGREVANSVLADLAENPRNPLLNRPTQGIYPSGSIMKVIDAVAVADTGVYDLTRTYFCSGIWQQGNDVRYDWLAGGHGRMTIPSAIANSCNPFFYQVGFDMNAVDPFLLPNYARRMGLGALTGLGALSEAAGTIPDPDWLRVNRGLTWTYSNAVNLAIGQGEVEVTPLQMTRMYAAIANGGTLYRPQLIRQTGILDQRTQIAIPEVNGRFEVREDVLAMVRRGMCDTVSASYGTAAHIFRGSPLLNIGVCGKTGTAQDAGSRPPHSWFMAYAPADNPRIAIGVMVENAGDGSAVAAPITRRILEWFFFGPFD